VLAISSAISPSSSLRNQMNFKSRIVKSPGEARLDQPRARDAHPNRLCGFRIHEVSALEV